MAQVADFDGDGIPDIVVIDDEHSRVDVYFGQRDGSFAAPLPLDGRGAMPYALAVADLNSDGATDIVVGNVQAPATAYFNDGSGRRYSPVSFGDNSGAVYGFAIADLDGDGILDIATARSEAPSVVYFGGMVTGSRSGPTRRP
jgi:Tfp pilus tip-associated adhesin PilY1